MIVSIHIYIHVTVVVGAILLPLRVPVATSFAMMMYNIIVVLR